MRVGPITMDELCYAAEGLSGTAAATSLRRLGSIMERAPEGRHFEAISTLADMSARAGKALEEGSIALDHADDGKAAARIGQALAHLDGLATLAAEADSVALKPQRRAAQ